MADELTWNMPGTMEYTALGTIVNTISIVAPSDDRFYIKGGLYVGAILVAGTEFFLVEDSTGAIVLVGVEADATEWVLVADDEVNRIGNLVLPQSDVTLILSLFKEDGVVIDADEDTLVDRVAVILTAPEVPSVGFDMNSMMAMILPIMMLGLIMKK